MRTTEPLGRIEFGRNPEVVGYLVDPAFAVQREQVARIYDNARRMVEAKYPPEQINEVAGDWLSRVDGISVLSEAQFMEHYSYRCAEWAFGTVQQEPWASQGFTVEKAPKLWDEPITFLIEKAYEFTNQGTPGTIVAFGDRLYNDRVWLEHFGIYDGVTADGQEMVVSKFGQGPLVRHPISLVSTVWGGYYFFLKKSS